MTDDPKKEERAPQIDVAALVGKWADWIKENQPAIKRFGQVVSAFLAKLPEWSENLEANTLLLQRGMESMREGGYGGVLHILSASDVLEMSASQPGELESRLFAESSKDGFKSEMLSLYKELGLPSEHAILLQEALDRSPQQ